MEQRVANNVDADVAAYLDLVNFRGFYLGGPVATAIQHICTVLESGQLLVSSYGFLNPVNRKYAEQLVQPVCVGGRTDAQLPTATMYNEEQEELVLAKCRQLIKGTLTAAAEEQRQYKQCMRLLAQLIQANTKSDKSRR